MSLLPDDSFKALSDIRHDFARMFSTFPVDLNFFDNMFSGFGSMKVDVYETVTEVIATCDLPGLKKDDDIQINVEHNMLHIRGFIDSSTEIKNENMFRQERYTGGFQRTILLPSPVSREGVKATYRNGILEVKMPKTAQNSIKNIDIDFY